MYHYGVPKQVAGYKWEVPLQALFRHLQSCCFSLMPSRPRATAKIFIVSLHVSKPSRIGICVTFINFCCIIFTFPRVWIHNYYIMLRKFCHRLPKVNPNVTRPNDRCNKTDSNFLLFQAIMVMSGRQAQMVRNKDWRIVVLQVSLLLGGVLNHNSSWRAI